MSKLKAKSEINLFAAKKLIDETYYAPSVHCSYYSCFQYFKYTVVSKLKMDEKRLASYISLEKGKSKKGSHQITAQLITDALPDAYKRDFSKKFKDLKELREKSDYHDEQIDFSKSNTALGYAQTILKIVSKIKSL